jgi:hypothetical protein
VEVDEFAIAVIILATQNTGVCDVSDFVQLFHADLPDDLRMSRRSRRGALMRRAVLIVAVCCSGLAAGTARAAELQVETSEAYDAYIHKARQDFLARVAATDSLRVRGNGVLSAGPGRLDGIVEVAGGLVHDWVGTAFMPGFTLQEVLDVSRAYSSYQTLYKAIVLSRLLGHEGDAYRVLLRVKEGEAGITAVLEIRSTIRYVARTDQSVYVISNADEIRQVQNAGRADERLLPAGRDSGYLWRANTFTHLFEHQGGVYVEMETIALSRRFPPLLGWVIEPIARRLGRKSVQTSLQEFLAAVQKARERRTSY